MAETTCARCGQPAKGYATIEDERYCHDDEQPTCYMRASWDVSRRYLNRLLLAEPSDNLRRAVHEAADELGIALDEGAQVCDDPRVHGDHPYQTRMIMPLGPVSPMMQCPGREEWKR